MKAWLRKYEVVVLGVILALVTIIPRSPEEHYLMGYHSVCPAAPISTLILLALAGLLIWAHRGHQE